MAEHTNASRRRRSQPALSSRSYVVEVDVDVVALVELVVVWDVVVVLDDVLEAVTVVVTVVGGPPPG